MSYQSEQNLGFRREEAVNAGNGVEYIEGRSGYPDEENHSHKKGARNHRVHRSNSFGDIAKYKSTCEIGEEHDQEEACRDFGIKAKGINSIDGHLYGRKIVSSCFRALKERGFDSSTHKVEATI